MVGPDPRRAGPPPAPVLETLPAELARLTPALRAVAREVLADPAAVALGSAVELARRAGTGTEAVRRLARELGHPTFGALQWAVRREHNQARRSAPPPEPW